MSDIEKMIETVENEARREMPRREFIQKSVMASGAMFVGMNMGTKVMLPNLNKGNPHNAASQPNAKQKGNNGVGNGEDPQPPGNPPINDGPGTGPGNPGNKGGPKNK